MPNGQLMIAVCGEILDRYDRPPYRDLRPPLGPVACKVGTMPEWVVFDNRCRLKIGHQIRLRLAGAGHKWFHATLTSIYPFRVSR